MLKKIILFLLFSLPCFSYDGKTIRYAADTESGAPFVFLDPNNPNKLIGFETEIIESIAKHMGVESKFVQNQWDGLVPGLQSGNYDVIINGIEVTEERKKEISFSEPYYITYEELTVHKKNTDIKGMADLKGKKVGTLGASLAEAILIENGGVDIKTYEAEYNAYQDLQNSRLDAVLLDAPIAIYYAHANADLKAIETPVGRIVYGIGVKSEIKQLVQDINRALKQMKDSGELREILERWALWNPFMADYLQDYSAPRTEPSSYESYLASTGVKKTFSDRLGIYQNILPILGKGALVTLKISLLSMILAVFLGFILAVMKLYGPSWMKLVSNAYIEIMRGTPLLIQLMLIFYGLPNLGIKLSPFVAAVLGLGLNYAACEAENYRAGILSIPKHQFEAAQVLGFNLRQTLFHIIFPQAIRTSLPPMTNDFIALLKDSSLVSIITMVELTKAYGQLASTYYDYLGIGLLVAFMYFILGLPFVRLAKALEKKFSVYQRA